MAAAEANRIDLSGRLVERGALRYTPSGLPAIEFRLAHESEQIEADKPRRVDCEIAAVALGVPALMLKETAVGQRLRTAGFLAARSAKSRSLVLHVTNIEFLEGNENGFQTEE